MKHKKYCEMETTKRHTGLAPWAFPAVMHRESLTMEESLLSGSIVDVINGGGGIDSAGQEVEDLDFGGGDSAYSSDWE